MGQGHYVEELTRDQCVRLLATVPVGWVAHCEAGRPRMALVNFILGRGEVIVRTDYGTKLAAAARDHVMTLAAEQVDPGTHTGWSVSVTGKARFLGDPLVNPGVVEPDAWAVPARAVLIAIPLDEVTGRQILTH